MSPILIVILSILGACLGGGVGFFVVRGTMNSKVARMKQQIEEEAETLKRNKLLEAKEKFLNMKAEFDKQISERNQKIQQS